MGETHMASLRVNGKNVDIWGHCDDMGYPQFYARVHYGVYTSVATWPHNCEADALNAAIDIIRRVE